MGTYYFIVLLICGIAFALIGWANYSGSSSRLIIGKRLREALGEEKCAEYQKSIAAPYLLAGIMIVLGCFLGRSNGWGMLIIWCVSVIYWFISILLTNKRLLGCFAASRYRNEE